MAAELSATMREAVDYARKHGGELERFPGGYWCEPGRTQWNIGGAVTFGTPTVAAIVARGVAEYTAWKDGRGGQFPIRVKLRDDLADGVNPSHGGSNGR